MLVSRVGMQPIIATLILFVAGRGIAMLFTNSMQIWLYAKPFAILGQGYVLGLPFDIYIVAVRAAPDLHFHPEDRGRECSSRRWESTRRRPGSPESTPRTSSSGSTRSAGFARESPGLIVCSTVMNADGNNAGRLFELDAILAVVLGGTSLNGGKFYLLGSIVGALIIQTLTDDHLRVRRPLRRRPRRQGARRVGRLPAAVPAIQGEDCAVSLSRRELST